MKKWITYVIVAIIVASIVGVVLVRNHYLVDDEEEVLRAEIGDSVSVHYTGWLNDDRIYDSRRVFDSSQKVIAEETIATFQDRERGDPFRFTLGEGVIEGWSEYLVGMREGQTKIINIPAEKAYDTYTDELLLKVDLEEQIPVFHEMRVEDFMEKYEQFPYPNTKVTDTFWNWNIFVVRVRGDFVELRHSPRAEEYYNTYRHDGMGWRTYVRSVDTSADRIVLRHHVDVGTVINIQRLMELDPDFEDLLYVKRDAGQHADPNGIVVDISDGIVTIDFNEEVAGKELTFKITMLEITKQG